MISVVIVNWNSGHLLRACLGSLREHAAGAEVIVVDNASDDGSHCGVPDWNPGARLVRNERNEGFAGGCNRGWRLAAGDLVLFLNPDTQATPGAVAAIQRCLDDHAEAWSTGGRLVDADGRPQSGFNVRAFPTVSTVAAEAFLLHQVWSSNPWTARHRMPSFDPSMPCEVDQPAGACLGVRRSALERLEGFDPRFHPAWWEDVDLSRRIWSSGGRIRYEPDAIFIHRGGSSLHRMSPEEYLVAFHTNELRYFSKHHGRAVQARVRALRLTGLRLRSAVSFVRSLSPGLTRKESARTFAAAARRLAAVEVP